MAKLVNGRGNLPIEKSFGWVDGVKVGLIRVSSGTKDQKVYARLLDMLGALRETGRAEVLLDIRDRRRKPLEVLRYYRRQKLSELPPIMATGATLRSALFAWVESATKKNGEPISTRTRRSYRNNFRQLLKYASVETRVSELPTVLQSYREWCVAPHRQYFVPFNQAKTACLAFARATEPERQFSALYQQIARIDSTTTKRKRDRCALRIYQVKTLMEMLPEPHRTHVWNFVITGMRFGEMSKKWKLEFDRVVIPGTKTAAANRIVPRLDLMKQPQFVANTFRMKLREVTKGRVVPLDFRATYARLLEETGIPESRIDAYFGHSRTRTVKAGYRTHEVESYLREDAERIKAFIEKDSKEPTPIDATSPERIEFLVHQLEEEKWSWLGKTVDRETGEPLRAMKKRRRRAVRRERVQVPANAP